MMKKRLAQKIILSLAVGMMTVGISADGYAATITSLPGSDSAWKSAKAYNCSVKYAPRSSSNNTINITLSGETELQSFAGGVQTGSAKANNNTVTINAQGAVVTNSVGVCGAASYAYRSSEMQNNAVTINGGTFKQINGLYGAWDCYGVAQENSITLNGVTVDSLSGRVIGGGAWLGSAVSNEVLIKDSTITDANTFICGGFTATLAGKNIVTIDNSKILNASNDIYGAYVAYDEQRVYANEVYIKNKSEVSRDWVAGGQANSQGCAIEDNLVSIDDSTVTARRIYGGGQGNSYKTTQTSVLTGNAVSIVNASLKQSSDEGLIVTGAYTATTGSAELYDNSVTISNVDMDASSHISLYGALARYDNAEGGYVLNENASIKNNTLNIVERGWTGKTAEIANFRAINFRDLAWKDEGIVGQTDRLTLDSENGTSVNVSLSQDSMVKEGDYMTLIQSDNTTGTLIAGDAPTITASANVAEVIEGEILQEGHDIVLRFGEERSLNEQVQVIGESRAAATAFVNQSNELIDKSINAMICEERVGYKTFASVYGNVSKYETNGYFNEYIRVNGWSGNVGVGYTTADGLTYGGFFETGIGNYRTYSRANGILMRGDGEVDYSGGGLLIRKDNENGFYTEASVHIGEMGNELSGAFVGSKGLTGYDVSTIYYGAHAGIGKIIPLGNDNTLDVYGKFMYMHHGGEDFSVDGQRFSFDSIDSQRLRMGVRYNDYDSGKVRMHYGVAWEYEFGGDVNNTVLDYHLYTPSLGGSVAIGEIGMHYNADEKWCFDVNLSGYDGKREGFSGSIQANYSF